MNKYRQAISMWATQPFASPIHETMLDFTSLWNFISRVEIKKLMGVATVEDVNPKLWLHAVLEEFVMWSVDAPGFTTKTKRGFMDPKRSYELYIEVSMAGERYPCACV